MTSDRDIWRAANKPTDPCVDKVWFHTAQRADQLLEAGDMDGRRVWRRIVEAINELQKTGLAGQMLCAAIEIELGLADA